MIRDLAIGLITLTLCLSAIGVFHWMFTPSSNQREVEVLCIHDVEYVFVIERGGGAISVLYNPDGTLRRCE